MMQVNAINSGQPAERINLNPTFNRINKDVTQPESNQLEPVKTTSPAESPQEKEITEEEVIAAIETANQKLEYYDTRVEFSIHEQTRQIMVKIFKNDELIREIPPEKILDLVAKMMEMAGLIVDETA